MLIDLKRRLAHFEPRSHERRLVIAEAAYLYGVSEPTLYRALAEKVPAEGFAPFGSRDTPRLVAQPDGTSLRADLPS